VFLPSFYLFDMQQFEGKISLVINGLNILESVVVNILITT
jgi:hypothetical protein